MEEKEENNMWITSTSSTQFVIPLTMEWQPKEDITTYELAMCLPFIYSRSFIMPYEIDPSLSYFRHFNIINPNK